MWFFRVSLLFSFFLCKQKRTNEKNKKKNDQQKKQNKQSGIKSHFGKFLLPIWNLQAKKSENKKN